MSNYSSTSPGATDGLFLGENPGARDRVGETSKNRRVLAPEHAATISLSDIDRRGSDGGSRAGLST